MAEVNISKIKINEYDLIIKDAQARENINSLSTNFLSFEASNNTAFFQIGQTLNELSSSTQDLKYNLNSLSTNINNNLNNLSTNLNSKLNSLSTDINNELKLQPEFHDITLPNGISLYPSTARTGYMIYPDGKVRIEVNVVGTTTLTPPVNLTSSTTPTVLPDSIIPTHAPNYGAGIYGFDNWKIGSGYFMSAQLINDGRLRVLATNQYAVGLVIEYYP